MRIACKPQNKMNTVQPSIALMPMRGLHLVWRASALRRAAWLHGALANCRIAAAVADRMTSSRKWRESKSRAATVDTAEGLLAAPTAAHPARDVPADSRYGPLVTLTGCGRAARSPAAKPVPASVLEGRPKQAGRSMLTSGHGALAAAAAAVIVAWWLGVGGSVATVAKQWYGHGSSSPTPISAQLTSLR